MESQFEHLKLPRIINIELPRRPGGGFGGQRRTDVSEHGRGLIEQLVPLVESVKQKNTPFRLDPKLIFKIKIAKEGSLRDDDLAKTGLNVLAREPNKAIVVFSSDTELKEFRKRLDNYSQLLNLHLKELLIIIYQFLICPKLLPHQMKIAVFLLLIRVCSVVIL